MLKNHNEIQLHHKIIELPGEKQATDVVAERHDIVFLFDAMKANPNGDPDTGNMPRTQPASLKGLVTDVCLKRKLRNFFSLYQPNGDLKNGQPVAGYDIFIRENAVLQDLMEREDLATKAEEELRVPELLDKGSPGKTRADAAKVPWSLQW